MYVVYVYVCVCVCVCDVCEIFENPCHDQSIIMTSLNEFTADRLKDFD